MCVWAASAARCTYTASCAEHYSGRSHRGTRTPGRESEYARRRGPCTSMAVMEGAHVSVVSPHNGKGRTYTPYVMCESFELLEQGTFKGNVIASKCTVNGDTNGSILRHQSKRQGRKNRRRDNGNRCVDASSSSSESESESESESASESESESESESKDNMRRSNDEECTQNWFKRLVCCTGCRRGTTRANRSTRHKSNLEKRKKKPYKKSNNRKRKSTSKRAQKQITDR